MPKATLGAVARPTTCNQSSQRSSFILTVERGLVIELMADSTNASPADQEGLLISNGVVIECFAFGKRSADEHGGVRANFSSVERLTACPLPKRARAKNKPSSSTIRNKRSINCVSLSLWERVRVRETRDYESDVATSPNSFLLRFVIIAFFPICPIQAPQGAHRLLSPGRIEQLLLDGLPRGLFRKTWP